MTATQTSRKPTAATAPARPPFSPTPRVSIARLGPAIATAIVASLFAWAAAQELPPGPTVVFQGRADVSVPDGELTLIHGVLEFAPGTRFPAHTHGGPALYTMIAGSVEVVELGTSAGEAAADAYGDDQPASSGGVGTVGAYDRTYTAGQSYPQEVGTALAAANDQDEAALMAVAFLHPTAEELTTFVDEHGGGESRQAPTMLHDLQGAAEPGGEQATLLQVVFELAPGAATPLHAHPDASLATVLEGEVIRTDVRGEKRVIAPLDGWTSEANAPYALANAGASAARYVITFLLEEGRALTRVHE